MPTVPIVQAANVPNPTQSGFSLDGLVNTIKNVTDTAKVLKQTVTPIISVLKPSVNTAQPNTTVSSSGNIFNSQIGSTAYTNGNVISPSIPPPSNSTMWYVLGGVALVLIGLTIYMLKK